MSINRIYYGKNKVYSFLENGNSGGGESTECNCEQEYQNGYNEGYNSGYNEGYNEGQNNCEGGGTVTEGTILNQIGWTTEDEISTMSNAVNYSKQIYENWDASITSTYSMFRDDKDLAIFPKVDMSNVEDATEMFCGCDGLVFLPDLYTPNLITANDMFNSCKTLLTAPRLNTEKCQSFSQTFTGCNNLRETPNWDFSNAISMYCTFRDCYRLKELIFDAPLCNEYQQLCAFSFIPKIIIDATSCNNIGEFFGWYGDTNGGTTYLLAKNLKTNWDDDNGFYACPNISYDCIKEQIIQLANVGGDTKTLKIHPNTMSLLSTDDIKEATNKGWIITA